MKAYNTTELHAFLNAAIDANRPVMLSGPPGVGKTALPQQIAEERGWGCVILLGVSMSELDVRGLPQVQPDGTTRFTVPSEFPQVVRDGAHGILIIDEITICHPSVQKALMKLIECGKVGEYTLPEGWHIVCTGNRASDRTGAVMLPNALNNRLMHFETAVDFKSWRAWAVKNAIHPLMIAFLELCQDHLHRAPTTAETTFPTPRSWANASLFCDAPTAMRFHLIASLVGEPEAAAFEAFAQTVADAPKMADILANPTSAPVPPNSKPSLLYMVSGSLARSCERDNIDAIMTYAKRLPREFEMLVVVDAIRRDPSLKSTTAFVAWAVKNQDLTL